MEAVARLNDESRRDLFAKTAEQMRMQPAIIEKVIPGSFRLLPDATLINAVNEDYYKTKEMIFGTPPTFESIVQTLKSLEGEINSLNSGPDLNNPLN
jgi:hypothetical protein